MLADYFVRFSTLVGHVISVLLCVQLVGADSTGNHNHGDHEQPFVDIENAEDQQKALDNYWKMMAKTFATDMEAYDYYNNYAKQHGFSIRKEGLRRRKGIGREVLYRKFVCSREGKRQKERLTMEGRTRRLRPESRCDCKAQLTVKYDISRKVWYVEKFLDDHNHILARFDEVHYKKSVDLRRFNNVVIGLQNIDRCYPRRFVRRY